MRSVLFTCAMSLIAASVPAWSWAGQQEGKSLAQQVVANMKTSGQMKHYEIRVDCQDGIVQLSGRVASREQLATAIGIAKQTPGVRQVIDDLRIEERPEEAIPHASSRRIPTQDETMAPKVRPTSAAQWGEESGGMPPAPMPNGAPPSQARNTSRSRSNAPLAYAGAGAHPAHPLQASRGEPIPAYVPGPGQATAARYDNPQLPNYAWPSYAPYPNYGAVTYPKQYSPTAWPYIGPFYPYPQVPLGWRKVTLEWDDGWWMLDFKD